MDEMGREGAEIREAGGGQSSIERAERESEREGA